MEELINTDKIIRPAYKNVLPAAEYVPLKRKIDRRRKCFDVFFRMNMWIPQYVIDFEKLYQEGYRGLIFDIDNTLVPHGAPADTRAIALFRRLKKLGFGCCLLSNNQKKRVASFNDAVQVNYIENAHKPSVRIITGQWRFWVRILRIPFL